MAANTVGGGITGLSTACVLKLPFPSIDFAVIERDPTYEFCSTLRPSGGCRVQFSCLENIDMSIFSIDFIRRLPETMRTATREAPVDWIEGGYLFIVPPGHIGLLKVNHAEQVKLGCEAHLLDLAALKSRFSSR